MEKSKSHTSVDRSVVSAEGRPARTSALPDAVLECLKEAEPARPSLSTLPDWFASFDPDGSSGRTCRAFCLPTAGSTSPRSPQRLHNAGIALPTARSTPSGCALLTFKADEWTAIPAQLPSDAGVCGLSDILEPMQPYLFRFFLSNVACGGIVRRAGSRKKNLPELLREALEDMLAWWAKMESETKDSEMEQLFGQGVA